MNSHVGVTVSDTGIGIAAGFPAARLRAVPPGGRRHRARRGGLGLGLAISRHLVELQGGRIFADSEGPGQGRRSGSNCPCEVCLRAPSHDAREHPARRSRHGADRGAAPGRRPRFWRWTTTATRWR